MKIPWRLTGFLVQGGLIAALLIAPMIYPEIIEVTLPHVGLTLTVAPKPVVERVQAVAAARQAPGSARSVYRPMHVPTRTDHPIANIIDDAAPEIPIGPSTVRADSSAFPIGGSLLSSISGTAPPPPAVKPDPAPKPEPPKRIVVGGSVVGAGLIHRVVPAYPPLAKQARVQGTVRLAAIIAADGSIQELRVISGPGLLVSAALAAVSQWRYRPTLLNNRPVEVATTIDVNFTLGQ